jgi:hypothetical protein
LHAETSISLSLNGSDDCVLQSTLLLLQTLPIILVICSKPQCFRDWICFQYQEKKCFLWWVP